MHRDQKLKNFYCPKCGKKGISTIVIDNGRSLNASCGHYSNERQGVGEDLIDFFSGFKKYEK